MKRNKLALKFREGAEAGTLSHAYILEGESETDALKAAYDLAEILLCESPEGKPCGMCPSCRRAAKGEHENLFLTERKEKTGSVKDEDVQKLQEQLGKRPLRGTRNVAIIKDADLMTRFAQNRLLKTLEEPPGQAVLILISGNSEHLLPTIISRCILYHIDREEAEEKESCTEAAAKLTDLWLGKRPFYEMTAVVTNVKEREDAISLLDALEIHLRNVLICSLGASSAAAVGMGGADEALKRRSRLMEPDKVYRAAALIEETRRDLNQNVNVGYTLKSMLLSMIGGK